MCTLSWAEFLSSAKEFLSLSEKLDDGWSLFEKDKEEGNIFLVFRQKINFTFEDTAEEETFIDETVQSPEDALSDGKSQEIGQILEMEYHVVYSISYQVPVLYFRGYRSDGKPIGLDDAWKIFHNPTGSTTSRADMLGTLTQSEHPVLFQPFLNLHPCRTAELLGQMHGSKNILLTFLSIIGPFVRLNLKNEYGSAFS